MKFFLILLSLVALSGCYLYNIVSEENATLDRKKELAYRKNRADIEKRDLAYKKYTNEGMSHNQAWAAAIKEVPFCNYIIDLDCTSPLNPEPQKTSYKPDASSIEKINKLTSEYQEKHDRWDLNYGEGRGPHESPEAIHQASVIYSLCGTIITEIDSALKSTTISIQDRNKLADLKISFKNKQQMWHELAVPSKYKKSY